MGGKDSAKAVSKGKNTPEKHKKAFLAALTGSGAGINKSIILDREMDRSKAFLPQISSDVKPRLFDKQASSCDTSIYRG